MASTTFDQKAYMAEWRRNNPERLREYRRRWNARHREQKREYQRQWREANPDYARQWYHTNRERCRELEKQRRAKNRGENMGNQYALTPTQTVTAPNGIKITIYTDGNKRFVKLRAVYNSLGYPRSWNDNSLFAMAFKSGNIAYYNKYITGGASYVIELKDIVPLLERFCRLTLAISNTHTLYDEMRDNARMEAERLIEVFNTEVFGKPPAVTATSDSNETTTSTHSVIGEPVHVYKMPSNFDDGANQRNEQSDSPFRIVRGSETVTFVKTIETPLSPLALYRYAFDQRLYLNWEQLGAAIGLSRRQLGSASSPLFKRLLQKKMGLLHSDLVDFQATVTELLPDFPNNKKVNEETLESVKKILFREFVAQKRLGTPTVDNSSISEDEGWKLYKIFTAPNCIRIPVYCGHDKLYPNIKFLVLTDPFKKAIPHTCSVGVFNSAFHFAQRATGEKPIMLSTQSRGAPIACLDAHDIERLLHDLKERIFADSSDQNSGAFNVFESVCEWWMETVMPELYGSNAPVEVPTAGAAETINDEQEDTQMQDNVTNQATVPTVTVADIEDIGERTEAVMKIFGVSKVDALRAVTQLKAQEINRELQPLLELLDGQKK